MPGACGAPVGTAFKGENCVQVGIQTTDWAASVEVAPGEVSVLSTKDAEDVKLEVAPARGMDVAGGKGVPVSRTVKGGPAGVFIDGRGRPLTLQDDPADRIAKIDKMNRTLKLYPELG